MSRCKNTNFFSEIESFSKKMQITVRAYEIIAMRWSIEVCFKECKQYLHL